jgi:dTMP kinase
MQLHRIGSGGLLPDLTLLLETDPQVAHARQVARDGAQGDRIGARDAEYHARVAARFVALAEAEPKRFVRVSTENPRDEVHRAILQTIEDRFEQAA